MVVILLQKPQSYQLYWQEIVRWTLLNGGHKEAMRYICAVSKRTQDDRKQSFVTSIIYVTLGVFSETGEVAHSLEQEAFPGAGPHIGGFREKVNSESHSYRLTTPSSHVFVQVTSSQSFKNLFSEKLWHHTTTQQEGNCARKEVQQD